MAEIAYLRGSAPRAVNGSVGLPAQHRPKNAELRAREYLTPDEVDRLAKAARDGHGRYAHRDATLILVAFRHGLRAAEIADLEWSQVELGRSASLHVRRLKNGKPSVHPLRGDEIRALRELRRQFPELVFRVRDRARRPLHVGSREPADQAHRRARQDALPGPRPHAPARLRLRPGQRRARHACPPGLAGPPQHSAHRQIYRAQPDAFQGLLAQLMWKVIQLSIVLPIVWSNLVWEWTTNMYLPVMIGIMLTFVLSEVCFDLRLWWQKRRLISQQRHPPPLPS